MDEEGLYQTLLLGYRGIHLYNNNNNNNNNKFILSPNFPSSSVDCTKSKTQYNYT